MRKEEVFPGMFLEREDGNYFGVEEKNGTIYFRFRDGSNDIVRLDQFDENLTHPIKGWSITKISNKKVIPPLCDCPETMMVRNTKNKKVYIAHKNTEEFSDGKDTETITTRYQFNGEVGSKSGFYKDYEGNITSDWFDQEVDNFYIKKNGKKIFIEEDDFILTSGIKKDILSYQYLLENYELVS